MEINVARWLERSAVNGPGERFVLWVQGCPLACPGCWNPDTWSFASRQRLPVEALEEQILATTGIEGVTFTGGEPFAQAGPLAELGRRVRRRGLSLFVFTGYDLAELRGAPARGLLAEVDVLVSGRFALERRTTRLAWRGSDNQEVHFLTDRYGPHSMRRTEEVEIQIDADGGLVMTGFPEDVAALAGEPGSAGLEHER